MSTVALVRQRAGQAAIAMCLVATAVVLGALVVRDARMAVAIPAAGIVGLLAVDGRIRWLVPATLVALAWGTSTLPLLSLAFTLKFAMLAIIALTAVTWLLWPRAETLQHLPVPFGAGIAFFGLLLFGLLSSAWSVDASLSVEKTLSMALLLVAAFIAVPLGLRDTAETKELVFRMAMVAAAVAVVGLVLGLADLVPASGAAGRLQGVLNSPNALGFLSAPLLPLLVVLASSEAAGLRRRLLLLGVVVLVVAIALSGSRAGLLAALAGVIVGMFAPWTTGQTRVARRALLVGLVAVGAAALAFPSLGLDVRSGTTGEGLFELGTGSQRSIVWGEALPLIAEKPLAGHGFGTTPIIFPAAQERTPTATILGRTHNSYLEAAVDLGWPGMLWLIGLIGGGLFAAWRLARRAGPDRVVGAALLAGIVGGAVEGMFESGLLAAGGLLAFPFWTIVALAFSLRQRQKAEGTPVRTRPPGA